MNLKLERSDSGHLLLRDRSRIWIEELRFSIRAASGHDPISSASWTAGGETARLPLRRAGRDVATAVVTVDGDVAFIRLDLHAGLDTLFCADSFEQSHLAVPTLRPPRDLSYFLVTYGLGNTDDPLGGYWPTARVGSLQAGLPERAFAPLVLFDDDGALAIAPASQFLTSALRASDGGITRSLHGSVDRLPAGTRIETVLARGDDVPAALLRLGDVLLTRGGKPRPSADGSILTSSLGWWNAYGGFFTEPIRPLTEERLVEVGDDLRQANVPIRYFGLDLWYPYRQIGQAVRFVPDPGKYPTGLRPIADRFAAPMVLHLSARASENGYPNDGADPRVYHEIAAELKRQGAIAAWHDWLRTQQHLTPKLRGNPDAADRWFAEMAEALDQAELDLLMCMQTMGMVLASTGARNAIAARSAIDYLFGQSEAFDTLDRLGLTRFRKEALPVREVWRQNLLVGSVLHAFGLLPFHDLFLTSHHPGLGGTAARVDALLRALSCGPVGIGDGPGRTDAALVRSLLDAAGHVLRPDRPPVPDTSTLGGPIETYRTVHVAGEACWEYVIFLNTTDRPQLAVSPGSGPDGLRWNLLQQRILEEERMPLAPGELACVMIAPRHAGIAVLGLTDKLVPAPQGVVRSATKTADGWRVELRAPGERFTVWSPVGAIVSDDQGAVLPAGREEDLVTVTVGADIGALEITRR